MDDNEIPMKKHMISYDTSCIPDGAETLSLEFPGGPGYTAVIHTSKGTFIIEGEESW